jgi:hypothetical protein
MKTLLSICITAMGLSAASLQPIRVTLAAPVLAGGVELPSGECTIQEESNSNVVLLLRCHSGVSVNVLVNRISGKPDNPSGIVLNLRNGRYSLDQVWLNDEEGFQVLRDAE